MADEQAWTASPGYPFEQLERALRRAVSSGDRAARARAKAKAAVWRSVLDGMAAGTLTVGSRTPVADTPEWVTLEVAHGGFATGRLLAEAPLRADEAEIVAALPPDAPGTTDREKLNLWYLTDAGQAELVAATAGETYRVDVPEDAALPVVAWLLEHDHNELALDLVAQLRPLMHRLRMAPRLLPTAAPAGGSVRLESVGAVKAVLRAVAVRPQIGAMLETLRVWHPLYDRLVVLWCDTVDGDLPRLSDAGGVAGGWPCRVWPADWSLRRAGWLADYQDAVAANTLASGHAHPRSNFSRLRTALLACERDSHALSGRDVGWVRRALANTVTKHGAPGSEQRAALRSIQAAAAARPTHADLAGVLAGRLDRYPDDGGIPSIDPVAEDVGADEALGVPAGSPLPAALVAKAIRALEAPVEELVARNVITSGDTLARVLPQITAGLLAANIADAGLAALYSHTYAAFRRRRSLLLLNLEHQIQFDELPWIGVLEPLRARRADAAQAARHTLAQTTLLALTAFPQAILPNPLVREFGALATQAGLPMPLVEEIAADIFMGAFTKKWRAAAQITSRVMAGTLYARYYDLPDAATWAEPVGRKLGGLTLRWGRRTAQDFADACSTRADEAQNGSSHGYVATNGTVLEQSQILTTHNLAVLVDALQLRHRLAELAPDLADRTFDWVVDRHSTHIDDPHATLLMIKNTAYAWRQAIFFLSFCDQTAQRTAVDRLRALVTDTGLERRLGPAIDGLGHLVQGGRFTATGGVDGGTGRRFLGWTTGDHWANPFPRR